MGSRPCAGSISVSKGNLDALLKHLGERMLDSPAAAACVGEEELLEDGLQRKGCLDTSLRTVTTQQALAVSETKLSWALSFDSHSTLKDRYNDYLHWMGS